MRLAHLAGRVEQLEAEKEYVESLLECSTVLSPIDGVALVDAPEEWAGKPIGLGQRIMTVAAPSRVRLEIFLPMNEFVPQRNGDRILFFPNINPGSPFEAAVYQMGYQAEETSQAGLAFRLRADFGPDVGALPRLGPRGTAKVYGSREALFSIQGAAMVLLAMGLSKAAHELGHAYAAKLMGLNVPSIGVAFMCFYPMLWTDTTEA